MVAVQTTRLAASALYFRTEHAVRRSWKPVSVITGERGGRSHWCRQGDRAARGLNQARRHRCRDRHEDKDLRHSDVVINNAGFTHKPAGVVGQERQLELPSMISLGAEQKAVPLCPLHLNPGPAFELGAGGSFCAKETSSTV